MKRAVIIDTDLTVDDIAALTALAADDKTDIKAVTVVGENTELLYNKATVICQQLGLNCKIAAGAGKPVFKDKFSTQNIYGKCNDSDFCVPDCKADGNNEYPWDIICKEAEKVPGQLEIVTLGPVTNIAITLLRYPKIKPLIKQIFVAAGAGYTGNAAPYSEYNAYCDPDALQIIIDSGVPVVLFPLEAAKSITGYSSDAMTAFISSEEIHIKDYYVVCETRAGENQGWTIIDRLGKYKKEPNISVVQG